MQVVVTMAGLGQRFKDQGYDIPKPFIKVGDKFAFQHLTETFPKNWKVYFVINKDLDSSYQKIIRDTYPDSCLVETNYSDRGPFDTVKAALPALNSHGPIIITYCDYSLLWNPEHFQKKVQEINPDAAVVGIRGFHVTYSGPNTYCHYQVKDQFITQLQEKKMYSASIYEEWTSCGMYYFRNKNLLNESLQEQLIQNLNFQGKEYYISLSLQAMLNKKTEFKILNYPVDYMIQLGTPFDIQTYEYWRKIFQSDSF